MAGIGVIKQAVASILFVTVFTSCTHVSDDLPRASEEERRVWSATADALRWLAEQQRRDGFWGTDENRVALTSLGVVAFLAHGEMPSSRSTYGASLRNALEALLREADTGKVLAEEENALLTWALAEAYGYTMNPNFADLVMKHAAAMRLTNATPWHVFAARAVRLTVTGRDSGKKMLSELAADYPVQTNSLLNQATRVFLPIPAEAVVAAVGHIRMLRPEQWRQSDRPLQTALALSHVLFHSSAKDWRQWEARFSPDLVSRQVRGRTRGVGWWTPHSLGVPETRETAEMNENDAALYATALMLLTLQRPRLLAMVEGTWENIRDSLSEEDDMRVDVGEL